MNSTNEEIIETNYDETICDETICDETNYDETICDKTICDETNYDETICDKQNYKYTGMSLFSGMGGDSLGMKQAGINVIAYSEYTPIIQQTHDINFPNCKLLGKDVKSDILKISDDEFLQYREIQCLENLFVLPD